MAIRERSTPQAWGKKTHIYTGLRKYYDYLFREYPQWFPTLTDLVEVSATLGIAHDEQKDLAKEKDRLAAVLNLDSVAFYVLMSLRFPEKTPEERLEELEKFAEYGVSRLYEEMKQNGEVGFLQYLKPALEACGSEAK